MTDRDPPRPRLLLLRESLAIARLAPGDAVPAWAESPSVLSAVVRTPAELSIVTAERHVPDDARAERGWRPFMVRGPLPFHVVGILAALTRPLAEAGIPIFSVSTFDTDWLLVREHDVEAAARALTAAGLEVAMEPEPVLAGHVPDAPTVGA